jgi:malate dehydrogenase (oxaloacetate-decarboxylating)(NADP+)
MNDDIQSTGCIATSAILSSLRARGLSPADIRNERILVAGAGSAGLGVCEAIAHAMVMEGSSEDEALQCFCVVDQRGVIGEGRPDDILSHGQRPFAKANVSIPDGTSLLEAVRAFKPNILLGLSGVGGLFTEDVVRSVAEHTDRPCIFPLSNPVSLSECTAKQAFEWTDGRALFASGSPFNDVDLGNDSMSIILRFIPDVCAFASVANSKVLLFPPVYLEIGLTNQCNNVYSFPPLGLAVTALQIRRVTDEMFYASAVRIAELTPIEDQEAGRLFPPIQDLRNLSAEVAAVIATVAIEQGHARVLPPETALVSRDTLADYMRSIMWQPRYATLVPDFS